MKAECRIRREAHGAGRWFSGNHAELVHEVEGYIAGAEVNSLSRPVIGVIAPHAG